MNRANMTGMCEYVICMKYVDELKKNIKKWQNQTSSDHQDIYIWIQGCLHKLRQLRLILYSKKCNSVYVSTLYV